MFCTPHLILYGDKIETNEMGRTCSAYGDGIGVYRVLWGNLGERDHCGDPGVERRIILRRILRNCDVEVWTGSSWLRKGTDGGHLRMR